MSKKHYVANNTKYYKHSNRSEIDHVIRAMRKNLNAFPELTKNNFGFTFDNESLNLKQNYELKLSEAKNQNPSAIQKQSNTFIDSVLVFDNELMHEILKSENGQERIEQSIKNYMTDFKKKYGFEPVGFQFHLDEGTFYTQKDFNKIEDEELKKRMVKTVNPETGEDGYLKQNFHAQAIFLNFNKETGKSCLRNMRKQDWRDCQDLIYKHFKEYGFDRGEPKKTATKDHLNKDEFVKKLNKDIEELTKEKRDLLKSHKQTINELLDLQDEIGNVYDDANTLLDIKEACISVFKHIRSNKKLFDYLSNQYEKLKELKVFKRFNRDVIEKLDLTPADLDFIEAQPEPTALPEPEPKAHEPTPEEPKQADSGDEEMIEDLKQEVSNGLNDVKEKKKQITKSQAKYSRRKRKN